MVVHSIQNTSVNLDGLLEVLGQNLYSDSDVAIRELIQNAADACHRHRLEDPVTDEYSIRLICDPSANKLVIEDNGSGLTYDEIKQFLATIGSGYSRLLRHETGTEDVVGYFGLGFLTAYIVASKVQVVTSSYLTPEEAWSFTSSKGITYAIAPCDVRPRGTTVTLWLEKEYKNLSNSFFLRSVIEKYCCLLPTPIFINDEEEHVNILQAPWLLDETPSTLRRNKLHLEFANIFETTFEPIAIFPIPEDNPFAISGMLWVQGGSSYASTDNRNLSVFTRNMFITNEDKELLPRWAGFAGGVIESSKFKPTASRETLQKDQYYKSVCSYLKGVLANALGELVTKEPATWRRVISRHGQALLGAAISDHDLFLTSQKLLKVPTTEGDMTIPELLQRGDGKIYIKPSNNSGHEEILFRARGNPLVKGFLYGATNFCQKYAEWNGVSLHTLGTEGIQSSIFKPRFPENESEKSRYLALFESSKYAVAFTSFTPEHIPLLVIENFDVIVKNKIESDEADKRISTAALSLARLTTAETEDIKESTIYLNLDNPIIRQIPYLDDRDQKNIAGMLRSMLEMLCGDNTNSDENLDTVFSTFNTAILALIEKR